MQVVIGNTASRLVLHHAAETLWYWRCLVSPCFVFHKRALLILAIIQILSTYKPSNSVLSSNLLVSYCRSVSLSDNEKPNYSLLATCHRPATGHVVLLGETLPQHQTGVTDGQVLPSQLQFNACFCCHLLLCHALLPETAIRKRIMLIQIYN